MIEKSTSYLLNNAESLQKEKIRLVKQAELFFEIEQRALSSKMPAKSNPTILDLGSGPGIYLSLVGKKYGSNRLFGYERNTDLIQECGEKYPQINCVEGDLLHREKLQRNLTLVNPDVIILRFVLHHLTKTGRLDLLNSIENVLGINQRLFIIEIDDSQIKFSEKNENLEYVLRRTIAIQAERGGDRLVGAKLQTELSEAGLVVSYDDTVWLELKNVGAEMIVDTLVPIWKSFSPSDSEVQKNELVRKLDNVSDWLRKKGTEKEFNFSFPIRLFVCEKNLRGVSI